MSSYDALPRYVLEILEEQRRTTAAVNALVDVLAGARKKFEAEAATSPKPDAVGAEPKAPSAPTAPTVASPSDVTREQVNSAVLALAKNRGRAAVLKVLGEFGADKVPALDPQHYAAVFEAATKAAKA
jgi:hypothetical protein